MIDPNQAANSDNAAQPLFYYAVDSPRRSLDAVAELFSCIEKVAAGVLQVSDLAWKRPSWRSRAD